jgi:hypothetical protein
VDERESSSEASSCRSTEEQERELKECKGEQQSSGAVQLEVRVVPVECPVGRRRCVR